MATSAEVNCDRCKGDPSALRLIITQSTWYLLDVTDEGIYPHQPEAADGPLLQLVCLDCGHEDAMRPELHALLRFE